MNQVDPSYPTSNTTPEAKDALWQFLAQSKVLVTPEGKNLIEMIKPSLGTVMFH